MVIIPLGVLGGVVMAIIGVFSENETKKVHEMEKFLHYLLNEKNETRLTEKEKEYLLKTLNRIKVNAQNYYWKKMTKEQEMDFELESLLRKVDKMIEKFYVSEITLKDVEEYQKLWKKYGHWHKGI